MTDFRRLLEVLSDAAVEFIVVGGVAAAAHGAIRNTLDLDLVYRRTTENIARLVDALQPFAPYPRGAPPGLPFVWDRRTVENGLNFTLVTQLGELDLWGEITAGGSYDRLFDKTIAIEVFGRRCRCVDL